MLAKAIYRIARRLLRRCQAAPGTFSQRHLTLLKPSLWGYDVMTPFLDFSIPSPFFPFPNLCYNNGISLGR
jgi:hypothetical protein